jgi:NSS family neurotransmitter:Na+ symporter
MKRDRWASRTSFILAAIGSAIGLGNVWRFPGQAAKYGGGTFLIVFIIALVTAGFPLLLMELAMGRKMQKGAAGTFKGLNKKMEWIGWISVATAFVITTYYAVVQGWVLVMTVKAFSIAKSPAPGDIFMKDVLQISSGPLDFGGFSPAVFFGVVVSWVIIYLCIRKGTETVGKIVSYTVIVPFILLVILAINGLTLPGSMAGFKEFITPVWSEFFNYKVWISAYGQVFYSLSIMMAIMITYGSFLGKDTDLTQDAVIIVIADALISFIAGVVIFTNLGYMSHLNGTEFTVPEGGIGLAFVVYPAVLASLPGGPILQTIVAVMFYLALLALAIDSAFSIVEAVSTAISDKFEFNKRKTTFYTCIVAGLISMIYVTKAGLYWLDIVDTWSNNMNLFTVGIIESISVGWFFGVEKIRKEVNESSSWKIGAWYDVMIKYFCPILFIFILGSFLVDTFRNGYEGYPTAALVIGGWLISFLVFASGFIIQIYSAKSKRQQKIEKNYKSWDEM